MLRVVPFAGERIAAGPLLELFHLGRGQIGIDGNRAILVLGDHSIDSGLFHAEEGRIDDLILIQLVHDGQEFFVEFVAAGDHQLAIAHSDVITLVVVGRSGSQIAHGIEDIGARVVAVGAAAQRIGIRPRLFHGVEHVQELIQRVGDFLANLVKPSGVPEEALAVARVVGHEAGEGIDVAIRCGAQRLVFRIILKPLGKVGHDFRRDVIVERQQLAFDLAVFHKLRG